MATKTNNPAVPYTTPGPNLRPPFYKRYKWPLLLLVLVVGFVGFQKAVIEYHQHQLEKLVQPTSFDNEYSVHDFARTDHCDTTYQGIFPSGANCYNYVDKLYHVTSDKELLTVLKFVHDKTKLIAPVTTSPAEYRYADDGTMTPITLEETVNDPAVLAETLAEHPNDQVFHWRLGQTPTYQYSENDLRTNLCVWRAQSAEGRLFATGPIKSLMHCGSSQGIEAAAWDLLHDKSGYVVALSFSQYRFGGGFPVYDELIR